MKLFIAFFALIVSISAHASQSDCMHAPLEEGDLIFTEVDDPFGFYDRVAQAMQTWTSHVGIVFRLDGEWVVYEQRPVGIDPFKKWKKDRKMPRPLCEFIQSSKDGHHAVLRLDQSGWLTPEAREAMLIAVDKEVALRYDFAFDFDDARTSYCSKFVHNVLKAASIEVGKIETLADIREAVTDLEKRDELIGYFTSPLAVLLTRGKFADLNTPEGWNQRVLGPASLLRDEKLRVVYHRRADGTLTDSRDL